MFLGWWGFISLFLTPIYLISNTIYLACMIFLPVAPRDAQRPRLDESVLSRAAPFSQEIVDRFHAGANIHDIAREIAPRAGLTPGQLWHYTVFLIRQRPPTQVRKCSPLMVSPLRTSTAIPKPQQRREAPPYPKQLATSN